MDIPKLIMSLPPIIFDFCIYRIYHNIENRAIFMTEIEGQEEL